MAVELKPRNNNLSCVHDAFVHSFEAGLLEPGTEEIIYYLPDNFPMHSIQQLCAMVKAELHMNCVSNVPADEQLIHFFVNPETTDNKGMVTAHAELLRLSELKAYMEDYNHLLLVGFIAFKGVECSPLQDAPERYHIPQSVRTLKIREEPLAA